jgi:hypothetical protein
MADKVDGEREEGDSLYPRLINSCDEIVETLDNATRASVSASVRASTPVSTPDFRLPIPRR